MTVQICVVNASPVLSDAEAAAVVPALQKWDDTMVAPAWGFEKCVYSFMPRGKLPGPGDQRWPIFLNRHSSDPGALGWHDDQIGKVFGRVFVGDCILAGVSWTVDLSHEAAEMRGNPTLNRTWTMRDGRLALVELADPVEDDVLAIEVDGVKLSDFVLPAYFSTGPGPYDYKGRLGAPCPSLAPGGYQSIYDAGAWTQLTAMRIGLPPSYRSMRNHYGMRRPSIPLGP